MTCQRKHSDEVNRGPSLPSSSKKQKSDVGHYTSLNQDTLICCSLISARFSPYSQRPRMNLDLKGKTKGKD